VNDKGELDLAFEMGQQSASYRVESLERRERAVEAAEARLREKAIVLGVAEWALTRDERNRSTICTFRIHDIDLKDTPDLDELVDAGKRTVEWGT